MFQITNGGLKNVLSKMYLYCLPNHVIRLFENWTKKCLKGQMFGLIQVLGIQMVTVLDKCAHYHILIPSTEKYILHLSNDLKNLMPLSVIQMPPENWTHINFELLPMT